jgi:hypothetical protein
LKKRYGLLLTQQSKSPTLKNVGVDPVLKMFCRGSEGLGTISAEALMKFEGSTRSTDIRGRSL